MGDTVGFVLVIILIALVFDFINGFHDSANSIATVVSTRVLSPGVAVAWAAFFNFIAAFTVGTAVAKTISKGLIDPSVVDPTVVLAALLGAIAWNLVTWFFGLPSSSSHALLGGYAGAAIAKSGISGLILAGWIKPLLGIVISPLLGMILGPIMDRSYRQAMLSSGEDLGVFVSEFFTTPLSAILLACVVLTVVSQADWWKKLRGRK